MPRPSCCRLPPGPCETAPSLERAGPPFTVTFGDPDRDRGLYRAQDGAALGPQVFFIEHPDFFDRRGSTATTAATTRTTPSGSRFFLCGGADRPAADRARGPGAPRARLAHRSGAGLSAAPCQRRVAAPRLGRRAVGAQRRIPRGTSRPRRWPAGVAGDLYNPRVFEWYGRMNILKGGLTVRGSGRHRQSTHAPSWLTPEGGFGLHREVSSSWATGSWGS